LLLVRKFCLQYACQGNQCLLFIKIDENKMFILLTHWYSAICIIKKNTFHQVKFEVPTEVRMMFWIRRRSSLVRGY
jgi:hypothetical protein